MFMRVVFPAPFSPRRAWISPGLTARSMWSFATTPGYRFVIPRISSASAGCGSLGASMVMLTSSNDDRRTATSGSAPEGAARSPESTLRDYEALGAAELAGAARTPHLSGHVLSDPAFIAAIAASSLDWRSALIRLFLSWKSE